MCGNWKWLKANRATVPCFDAICLFACVCECVRASVCRNMQITAISASLKHLTCLSLTHTCNTNTCVCPHHWEKHLPYLLSHFVFPSYRTHTHTHTSCLLRHAHMWPFSGFLSHAKEMKPSDVFMSPLPPAFLLDDVSKNNFGPARQYKWGGVIR